MVYYLDINLGPPHLVPSVPMSPMTPGTISSLLNSIGRGGIRCIALLRLHPCASIAIEVEDSENVIPTMIPITMSRVKRVGSLRRCHTLENMSVQAISRQSLDDIINRNLEMQMTIPDGQISQARLLCWIFRDGVITVASFLFHSATSRHIQHSLRYVSLDRSSPLFISCTCISNHDESCNARSPDLDQCVPSDETPKARSIRYANLGEWPWVP
jgi:hypothetical protein